MVFSQNHDQIGNRLQGDRLVSAASLEAAKLAAALVILSPNIPLLFMGEEYAETAPFPYFISHTDPDLVEAVREGRKEEFSAFAWGGEPPDPFSEATFASAKLDHSKTKSGKHAAVLSYYKRLISLRKENEALSSGQLEIVSTSEGRRTLAIRRWTAGHQALLLANLGSEPATIAADASAGTWTTLLDSADVAWAGPGSAIPSRVSSVGEISLTLPPTSGCLLGLAE